MTVIGHYSIDTEEITQILEELGHLISMVHPFYVNLKPIVMIWN